MEVPESSEIFPSLGSELESPSHRYAREFHHPASDSIVSLFISSFCRQFIHNGFFYLFRVLALFVSIRTHSKLSWYSVQSERYGRSSWTKTNRQLATEPSLRAPGLRREPEGFPYVILLNWARDANHLLPKDFRSLFHSERDYVVNS